jgi:hypothetical protein
MTTLKYEVFSGLQEAMYSCLQWGGNEFHMINGFKSNGGGYSTFVKGPVNVDEYAIWLTHALSADEIAMLHALFEQGTSLREHLGL